MLPCQQESSSLNASSPQQCPSLYSIFKVWHNRLGHSSSSIVKTVMPSCNVQNINKIDYSFCSACCLGKVHKFSFLSTWNEYPAPLRLIHTNVWGPSPIPSFSGYKYYMHFIDDYTKFTWIYLLEISLEHFKHFVTLRHKLNYNLGLVSGIASQIEVGDTGSLLISSKPVGSIIGSLIQKLINKMERLRGTDWFTTASTSLHASKILGWRLSNLYLLNK